VSNIGTRSSESTSQIMCLADDTDPDDFIQITIVSQF
jgi:hypothetical protein